MTARELRKYLFDLDNQDMTVKELRAMLFEIDDQDSEIIKNAISSAASTLGSIKSEKKAKSSRENGMKGGRPKGER